MGLMKTGCQWRFLPKEYPSWKTVYSFYKRAKDRNIWETMMKDLVEKSRIKMGRNPDPSYSLIDSQSVKTTDCAQDRGFDGGKKDQRT
jgi:transposase